jgi:hypothetical protein
MPNTTTVVNIKTDEYDVYIGRPSDGTPMHYGNPFTYKEGTKALINVGGRRNALEACDQWLDGTAWEDVEPERRRWILATLPRLRGKRLGCFCVPAACHGDLYVRRLDGGHVSAAISPWHAYPSNLRSLINSEQDADRERAMQLCEHYGLDYEAARRRIIAEMVREQSANEPARARRRGR